MVRETKTMSICYDVFLRMKYFILNPEGTDSYANASREALVAYAESIKNHDPALAKDIWEWVDQELTKIQKEKT